MEEASIAVAGTAASWLNWLGHAASSRLASSEAQVLMTSLAIIWLGAHASIRRPPSAAPNPHSRSAKARGQGDDDNDRFIEGFVASDAILFPLCAGCMLMGLYYLIQWLQDPNILSNFLGAYLSAASVISLSALSADFLHLLVSLVFPDVWTDRHDNLYRIDPGNRCQLLVHPTTSAETVVADKITPLPGSLLSCWSSHRAAKLLWDARNALTEGWTIRLAMRGIGRSKTRITLGRILGIAIALANLCGYWLTGWPVLSNMMGSSLSYASFGAVSATSVPIGTMVLCGLFVYDIAMVFYTPYMVMVATKIDAPIKLVFENKGAGPGSVSMLGLGDIVVPGLLIGLALRFDLYLHYLNKIAHVPVERYPDSLLPLPSREATDSSVMTTETPKPHLQVKTPFIDPRGQWGNRLWTMKNPWSAMFGSSTLYHPVFGTSASAPSAQQPQDQDTSHSARLPVAFFAASFPKPYFYASMAGYLLGMLATLVSLRLSGRGQPALLYLVPGVAGAVWLTALVRGDLRHVCTYTEDGSLDTKDVLCELDPKTGHITQIGNPKNGGGDDEGGATTEGKKGGQIAWEGVGEGEALDKASLAHGPRLRVESEKKSEKSEK